MPQSTAPTARVFFALVPPREVQQTLGEVALETARRAHGRPVPAENLHITLAFIGAWPVARLPTLLDAAARVHGEPMHIALDTLGAFRRAGIAWIGPSLVPDALTRLAMSLADALSVVGVVLDAQPYRPHVTLARHCRGPYPDGASGPFRFDADRFVLMQSQTPAEGARYSVVADWPLDFEQRGFEPNRDT
ncbi:MAG TPA: RNA 2',3'-cyclic phosphodiesterase [Casimicrobiaceae bacterium]